MELDKPVKPEELKTLPLFECLPYKFLSWNANAVVPRGLNPKDVLFREGQYGSTAFILMSGALLLEVESSQWHARSARSKSFLSRWLGHRAHERASRAGDRATSFRSESGGPRTLGQPLPLLGPDPRRIIGEAACLNNYPRADTATAVQPSVVLEFRRNLLLAMLRHPRTHREIREGYRRDALVPYLMGIPMFEGIRDPKMLARCAQFLADRLDLIEFKHVQPGRVIFRQGDPADELYLVRVGFVKVSRFVEGHEIVYDYVGPGGVFGELGLIAGAAPDLADLIPVDGAPGRRLTTCTALDTVDMVRIRRDLFVDLMTKERGLESLLVDACRLQIEKYWGAPHPRALLATYLEDGLQSARQLLVIDLQRCTRCDECSKACADSHDGVTRLVREGVRHDKYLVATSCRSCLDPYCMAGCPVDSIHRGANREIVIEDWCIGCGSCESHCPYDNIRMVEDQYKRDAPDHPGRKAVVLERKATTCDLCQGFLTESDEPSCVFACPHDAIGRMNGKRFLDLLMTSVEGGQGSMRGDQSAAREHEARA